MRLCRSITAPWGSMKNTKVVNLAAVKELLAELDRIRQRVLSGEVDGWMGVLREGGTDTVYVGGVYGTSSATRLQGVLKMSAARMAVEDPPLSMRRG